MANNIKDRSTKFKNFMGTHLLKPLFFEQIKEAADAHLSMYTMKDYDHTITVEGKEVTLPSIKRLFVEMEDTTEYLFANEYFDNFQHWKKIKSTTWFAPLYEEMKEELVLKLQARALKKIRDLEDHPDKGWMVNKYLLEEGYRDKKDTRGRPSKAKIKEEADKLLLDKEEVNEDYSRLFN